ncbi:PepSY domain-containing protein [Alkalihalobacterium alkalicellulosilyticum]|uniref:PepSY domain-containing protein n=1 Tax=Alkalihalobacterium alkalicellulosilyticum TaxID=1912214 RepID=UPI003AF1A50D
MGMKRFVLGLGIGIAAGMFLKNRTTDNNIQPERALKMVKQNLANKVNITGAWIHMIPESFEKENIDYTVYRGGITTTDNDENTQYDFVVDSKTGTILELVE